MKNYPNQASSFGRIRGTLLVISELLKRGENVEDDGVLGYAAAKYRIYTFRGLVVPRPTEDQLNARIASEKLKPAGLQGARTFARELRRTLRDMGWLDANTNLTDKGRALLDSEVFGTDEQALLVEGLLNIQAMDKQGNAHHPVQTMLRLLAISPSQHRHGLELALEPLNDSQAEFDRVAALYALGQNQREADLKALGATDNTIANAVKIFPALADAAGLVIEEDGLYSLSQDGWRVIGETPTQANATIRKRRGRRMTVGKKVTTGTVAKRRNTRPSRALSEEEQRRASERLAERTDSHQSLVKRVTMLIGDDNGMLFEDEFSYDLIWVPEDNAAPVALFEMKSIVSDTDAYARVKHAVGQLSYYAYFQAEPTFPDREIRRIAAFDASIPDELVSYMSHEGVGVIIATADGEISGLNPAGEAELDSFQEPPAAA